MFDALAVTVIVLAVLVLARRLTLARIQQHDSRYARRGIGQLEAWLSEHAARRPAE